MGQDSHWTIPTSVPPQKWLYGMVIWNLNIVLVNKNLLWGHYLVSFSMNTLMTNHLLWFNPSRQLSTTELLTHYPSRAEDGGENWKGKSARTRGLRYKTFCYVKQKLHAPYQLQRTKLTLSQSKSGHHQWSFRGAG